MKKEVMRDVAETKKKNKKRVLIFLSVAVAVGIISGVLLLVMDRFEKDDEEEDTAPDYIFHTPDYDLDVTAVDEYMELDRMLYYKDGGVEVGIEGGAEEFGDAAVFFKEYFDAAISGDVDAYREMFTQNYKETAGEEDGFAPQMIYDIHVERLRGATEDDRERIAFNVSYRIYKNNGTLRDDMGSDAAKPLYFELAYDNGVLKIDRITYYK